MTQVPGEIACAAAAGVACLRWLRVAQREHYLAGSVSRFAWRWWLTSPANTALVLMGAVGTALAFVWPLSALAAALVALAGPLGLAVRGRTSRLKWTRRLTTLAAVWLLFEGGLIAGGVVLGVGAAVAAVSCLAVPSTLDIACWSTSPVEGLSATRYVARARSRLEQVRPVVVAVTGSYGKTTTKNYIAHLLGGSCSVVASPASFNNRAGLSRTVNELLGPGTDVVVAEMGAYGPGEIADLCSWLRPRVGVITAIAPVHLERFGSLERILRAKSEIIEGVPAAVLNVDDERLSGLADSLPAGAGQTRVVRCSSWQADADVACLTEEGAEGARVLVGGDLVAKMASLEAAPTNVACAVAVAHELGVSLSQIESRLDSLPVVENRMSSYLSDNGFTVIDDTYNSNPDGCRLALQTLMRKSKEGHKRVVVTPGMIELGPLQREENAEFARSAAAVATDLIVVGRTNRRSLLEGSRDGALPGGKGTADEGVPVSNVWTVRTRQQAVDWIRANLGPGDVVLYENDLPDHYA